MATTAKGEARRQLLLDAALRILERDGTAGVTHRAVATEAGVPLAAATYYFASIDELMLSSLRLATEQQVALFSHLAATDLRVFAEVLVDWAITHRTMALAQYELMFLAMRRPALRSDAELWYAALADAVTAIGLSPERADVVAIAIDGLVLRMLWRQEPSDSTEVETLLREIIYPAAP